MTHPTDAEREESPAESRWPPVALAEDVGASTEAGHLRWFAVGRSPEPELAPVAEAA